jgi:hypothetical protein
VLTHTPPLHFVRHFLRRKLWGPSPWYFNFYSAKLLNYLKT